jgi:hypothetical protein
VGEIKAACEKKPHAPANDRERIDGVAALSDAVLLL